MFVHHEKDLCLFEKKSVLQLLNNSFFFLQQKTKKQQA